MRSILIFAATVVLLGGCSSESPPPVLDQPPEIFSTTTANQPRSVTAMKPVLDEWEERRQPVCLKDDFGLPLVIVLEAPEVPAEISGPSPPIEEAPEEAPKTKNGWWW